MSGHVFKSFAEAAAAAKTIARDSKALAYIVRRGNDYIVETNPARAPRQPRSGSGPSPSSHAMATQPAASRERLCIDCGLVIPPARLAATPSVSRCLKCQSAFEKTRDTRPRIDEGLAGTREGHKRMRAHLWGDMRNRSRGRK